MAVTKQVHSVKTRCSIRNNGFTLIEVIIAITIAVIINTIVFVVYKDHIESRNTPKTISQIAHIAIVPDKYIRQNNYYPDSLADIGMHDLLEPRNNRYQYNVAQYHCADVSRKVLNISTLNISYDLYSIEKDGTSGSYLSAKTSRNDVIRASHGNYMLI